jgi:hypothetical protein
MLSYVKLLNQLSYTYHKPNSLIPAPTTAPGQTLYAAMLGDCSKSSASSPVAPATQK